MKHSTFYNVKGEDKIYTTIKLTDHHKFLRDTFNGRTFEHENNAILYFMNPSMPLEKPLRYVGEIVSGIKQGI